MAIKINDIDYDIVMCQNFFSFYAHEVKPWDLGYKMSPYYNNILGMFDRIIKILQDEKMEKDKRERHIDRVKEAKDTINADKPIIEDAKRRKKGKRTSISETHNPRVYLGSADSDRVKELLKRNITGDNLYEN